MWPFVLAQTISAVASLISSIGLAAIATRGSSGVERTASSSEIQVTHKLDCVCACQALASPPELPTWILLLWSLTTLLALLLGYLCGSCCPRAAVRHSVVTAPGPGKGSKGVWGTPSLTF